jgi:hypothetical protein
VRPARPVQRATTSREDESETSATKGNIDERPRHDRASGGLLTPKRTQLSRAKGWRKPEGVVVVARPTQWGNPWLIGDPQGPGLPPMDARAAVTAYRRWLTEAVGRLVLPVRRATILRDLPALAGKDLACWCPPDAPCHADVLLDLANPSET